MIDRTQFVIAVDGFCDENAEQLVADGVKIFPTNVFIGGEPIDLPTNNAERNHVVSLSKNGENTVISSTTADYERFFDSVLDERDGGDLLFLCVADDFAAAQKAAENCMVKFYGSNVLILPVHGKGAAVVPLLERALSLRDGGESAQNTFAELNSAVAKIVSFAIVPNADKFATYKIVRFVGETKFDRLCRGNAKIAALVANEVKNSNAGCVYVSHAGNHAFVTKIATAIAETCPGVKIKTGFCSPATIAVTAPRAVSIGYISRKL